MAESDQASLIEVCYRRDRALAGMALYRVLLRLGLAKVAPFAVLTAGLASTLWVVGSQALWQHGPVASALTVMIELLMADPLPPWRLVAAGATAGGIVAFRFVDVVFAVAAFGFVACHRPKGLPWFLPAPLLIGSALVAYNFWSFGTLLGGLAQIEGVHSERHGVAGTWSGDLRAAPLGTLFSPARGLSSSLHGCALAILFLPAYWRSLQRRPLLLWLLGALMADLLVLSKYSVWWAVTALDRDTRPRRFPCSRSCSPSR